MSNHADSNGAEPPSRPASQSVEGSHERTHARRWLILAVIATAQLMVVLDTTIVNIALPSAQRDLDFDTTSRQWVVTSYALAFGSLLLLGGRLSDIFGRRRTLLIGLLGFAIASALGGAATNFELLITARTLQGVFAAVLAPAALSTLNVTFVDAKERARAFAVYAAVAGTGAVVGLILGGMLTEWLSWRWCLYVNLAFALPAVSGVLAWVRARDKKRRGASLDWRGALTASGGLFCLVYGLSNAETDSWGDPATIGMLVASGLLLASFVIVELRVSGPLLPMRVVTDRNRAASYLAISIGYCGLFGALLFLTYYLQRSIGFSPLETGLAFLPLTAGLILGAGASNAVLVSRFGPRPLVSTGMAISSAGMLWLAQLSTESTYAGDVLAPAFVLGLGMGLIIAPSITAATDRIAHEDTGVGSAMVNTSQQIGGAVGTAALSTVFSSAVSDYISTHAPNQATTNSASASRAALAQLEQAAAIDGYTTAFAISCGLFAAGCLITALLFRSGELDTESAADLPAAHAPDGDAMPEVAS